MKKGRGNGTMMNVRESTLSGGIRVITAEIPRVESVALGIWVGVGARHETKKSAGASHFVEHLLFKGTKKRSAREITRMIEGRGGYLNAFTQEENTCYYARVPYDRLPVAVEVLSDMYRNSVFAEKEIEKERGVIMEEIMMYRDQPHHVVDEMLRSALWKNHPLGRPVIGNVKSLAAMSRADLLAFQRRNYVPGKTLFAFAGRLDHASCVRCVQSRMSRSRNGAGGSCRTVTKATGQERLALGRREIEQAHLALGFRLFGRKDPRRYALRVLNGVLGENMSSRLFQIVRERHGLAYSVHSSAHLLEDTGALVVTAGLDRKRDVRAVELILRELSRLKEQAVGEREMKRAKDYIIGQLRLGLESTTAQMMWIGDNIMAHGRFIPPEEVIQRLTAVTAEDVRRLARSLFRFRNASLAMLSRHDPLERESRIGEMLSNV